jgi:hypothetical protein
MNECSKRLWEDGDEKGYAEARNTHPKLEKHFKLKLVAPRNPSSDQTVVGSGLLVLLETPLEDKTCQLVSSSSLVCRGFFNFRE